MRAGDGSAVAESLPPRVFDGAPVASTSRWQEHCGGGADVPADAVKLLLGGVLIASALRVFAVETNRRR